jgi:hypothetical protein
MVQVRHPCPQLLSLDLSSQTQALSPLQTTQSYHLDRRPEDFSRPLVSALVKEVLTALGFVPQPCRVQHWGWGGCKDESDARSHTSTRGAPDSGLVTIAMRCHAGRGSRVSIGTMRRVGMSRKATSCGEGHTSVMGCSDRLLAPQLALLSFLALFACGVSHARVPEAVEVRSLLTDEWGVPHPSGVAYFPEEGYLLVPEGKGREAKILRLSPFEESLGRLSLPPISHPATLAFDAARSRLTAISGDRLLTVRAAELGKGRPRVRWIGIARLGLEAPAGATSDAATGTWYVLDQGDKAIERVPMPGGSPGTPARISLQGLGAENLQGLALNPSDGLFYVASPARGLLYGVDGSGAVEKTYDLGAIELGGAGLQDLRALVFAPSSDPTDDPATHHLFIADKGSSSTLGGVAEVSLAAAEP